MSTPYGTEGPLPAEPLVPPVLVATPVLRSRFARRRYSLAALVFIVYGLFGVAILSVSAVAISTPLTGLDDLTGSLERDRAALVRSLRTTSEAIGSASTGVGNVGASLTQARRSSDQAAALARDVSGTMSELAQAMNLSILGAQPLIGLAPSFQRAAQGLSDMGTNLEGIGSALSQNTTDTTAVAARLSQVRGDLGELARLVDEGPRLELPLAAISSLRLVLYALVGWLLLMAFTSLFVGVWLLRLSRAGT